jgi:hypothetical protein
MMAHETRSYPLDNILCKMNRTEMANNSDTHVTFHGSDVIALSASSPENRRTRGDACIWALRQIFFRKAPRAPTEPRETGLGIPAAEWLCSALRDPAEPLFEPEKLNAARLLNAASKRLITIKYLSGPSASGTSTLGCLGTAYSAREIVVAL